MWRYLNSKVVSPRLGLLHLKIAQNRSFANSITRRRIDIPVAWVVQQIFELEREIPVQLAGDPSWRLPDSEDRLSSHFFAQALSQVVVKGSP